MGLLINGEWHTDWYDTKKSGGRFERPATQFHHRISNDPNADFPAEADRYHLYVSLACPWAHRTLIMRHLKGLEDIVSLSVVDPLMGDDCWAFSDKPGCIADNVNGCDLLREVYLRADANYSGRVTVPVLWDKKQHTIVNNESADILRIFNCAFDEVGAKAGDYCPKGQHETIDKTNHLVYHQINNGVYKAGFATSQPAYEEAVTQLFAALDQLEERLDKQRYLIGNQLTEADIRLVTTLFRFDAVYYSHFKCNLRQLRDYRNLSGFCRDLYQLPGVADTVNLTHIKQHYYMSHPSINPNGIVPLGPQIDFNSPHDRNRFG